MPELRCYSKDDVPRDFAVQIVSYVRVQWPFMLGHKPPLWETTPYPEEGKHFILNDGDILIAHALAHQKALQHRGQSWNVGALSSVFTYPTHRGVGYGERVVAAATRYLRDDANIDFALLFCGDRVKSLYLRTGWEDYNWLQVSYGDEKQLRLYHEVFPHSMLMGLAVSERATRQALEGSPIYVGKNTW